MTIRRGGGGAARHSGSSDTFPARAREVQALVDVSTRVPPRRPELYRVRRGGVPPPLLVLRARSERGAAICGRPQSTDASAGLHTLFDARRSPGRGRQQVWFWSKELELSPRSSKSFQNLRTMRWTDVLLVSPARPMTVPRDLLSEIVFVEEVGS